MPAENITIKAKWSANSYTITFDTDGGTSIPVITQAFGTAVTAPADPAKTGYTFVRWDREIPATMPASNITLTAMWEVNSYTLSFDSDGGSACNALPFEYGQPLIGLPTPIRDGYTFDGWYINGHRVTEEDTMPAGNITLTALWKVNRYKIFFDSDGGSACDPVTFEFGAAIDSDSLPKPTRDGYTFAGWKEVPSTMPANDLTLTAMWEVNTTLYTVSYTSDEPNLTFADAQYKENEVIKHPTPYARGYKFTGWVQADGSPAPKKMPAQNLSLSARWEELPLWQASIEIVGVDGLTSYPALRLYEGEFINLPTFADVKIDDMLLINLHTLLGWSVKYSSDPVPQTMPAGNITLVVRFGEFNSPVTAAHTVTYNTGCSSPNSFDKTVYADEPLPRPDPGAREGYQFVGWYEDTAYTTPARDTMPDTDYQLFARWIDLSNPTAAEVEILCAMGYAFPVVEATATPTPEPTATPTPEPTSTPTLEPTATPTLEPTATPTLEPTATPTPEPTATPTPEPTAAPTLEPTAAPTPEPTATPTPELTATPKPATPDECA